jgi:hypothetical protein
MRVTAYLSRGFARPSQLNTLLLILRQVFHQVHAIEPIFIGAKDLLRNVLRLHKYRS